MQPFLSIIIPVYNEAKRINKTLLSINEYLKTKDYSYEIIVVNDGSKDETIQIVKSLMPSIKNLILLDNKKNCGKGYAVKQGMLSSQGKYRVFTDADNSTSIDHFEKMLPWFEKGYDVVIGSRRISGARIAIHQPFWKEFLGRIGNLIIRLVAIKGIKDTQCGFKGFTAKSAEDIFKRLTINRWGFDIEVLAIAKALGYKIKEIPVYWINDPMTHVRLNTYFQVLFETFKIRWNLIVNKYDISKKN